ncbi:MAG: Gmad2 immunoglobulin-like domain-containing protein [Anaerolineae bacterium]
MDKKKFSPSWIFMLIGFVMVMNACQENSQVPTAVPTAAPATDLPTELSPTAARLPPTLDLAALTNTPVATAVPNTPSPPASTPTPPATIITITDPEANADLLVGDNIVVRGLAQIENVQSVWVTLATMNGQVITETQAIMGDVGWQAGFTVPSTVNGAAILQAAIRNADGSIVTASQLPVNLALDTEAMDRYLVLYRPVTGDPAMGGYNFFFDGRAQRPAANLVTITVWADNCQTQVAKQSFVLRGSGYWQGFVILPANTNPGPGCAIAYFGDPGSDNRREVHIPITIHDLSETAVNDIRIGNPPPDRTITAGQQFLVYGTALNASEATLQISVLLENGRIIDESEVTADFWGYWEHPVILPPDVEGPAVITAVRGAPGEDNYTEAQTFFTIAPAP